MEVLEERFLLDGTPITQEFQKGVLPSASYIGTQDTYLSSLDPNANFGAGSPLTVDGSPDSAALLKWDISGIPNGSSVQSASITLNVTSFSANTYDILELKQNWLEASATWNSTGEGSWELPGADGQTDRGSTVLGSIHATVNGLFTIPLNAAGMALVQSWVSAPGSNHGIIVQNYTSATDRLAFSAKEASATKRPKLSVTYVVGNQAPSVDAGAAQSILANAAANLDGTVADDGLPNPPASITTTWTTVSGPGTVTFGNASTVDTTASFSDVGTYVLRLAAGDGELSASDDVTITVNPVISNQSPTANAGQDQIILQSGAANLDGTVADDGLPNPPGAPSASWSMVSGPGTVTFGNASAADTTARFSTPGDYALRLTVSDGLLSATDDVMVTVNPVPNTPPVVSAGPDLVMTTAAMLDATVSDDGLPNPPGSTTVLWTQVSGPGTATFGDATAVDTASSFSVAGDYVLRLTAQDGEFTVSDDVRVTVSEAAALLTQGFQDGLLPSKTYAGVQDTWISSAQPDATFGATSPLSMDGSPDEAALLMWDVSAVPVGSIVTSVALSLRITSASPDSFEIYELKRNWSESSATWNSTGAGNWETPGADGASDRGTAVLGTIIGASAGIITVPLNAAGIATVQSWVDSASANHGIIVLDYNTLDKIAFSSSEKTPASDRPKLRISYVQPNQAPTVSAGSDQSIIINTAANLDATVSDDNLPNPPGAASTRWSVVSGPGEVTFGDATAADTTARFEETGTYVLRLTSSDGVRSSSDEVTITVNAVPNQAPSVNAGSAQTILLSAAATLDGTVSDDGLPNPPAAVTTAWSVVSGPGSVSFGAASSVDTTARFSAVGTYVLRLAADDGLATTSADVTVTVNPVPNAAPFVNAGPDQQLVSLGNATLDATVSDDGKPMPPGSLSIQWTQLSGPGTTTFGNSTAVDTTATFSTTGTYVLRLTASDGELSTSDDVTITIGNTPPQVGAGPSQTVLVSLGGCLDGTVQDDGLPDPPHKLSTQWSVVGGPGTVTFSNVAAVDTSAVFSAAGTYVLRLTANDGEQSVQSDVTVTVAAGPAHYRDIWVPADQLRDLPTSGPAWDTLFAAARQPTAAPDLKNQDEDADVLTLAKALVGIRLSDQGMLCDVRHNIIAAIGTEAGGRTLALSRNLASYVVAAGLVGLDDAQYTQFSTWLRQTLTEVLDTRTLQSTHEKRPNNWGTMAGASRAAVAAYLGDQQELDRVAQVFKGYVGDRTAYAGFTFGDDLSWQADPANPVGINPVGAIKNGHSIDGALPDDMRRGGPFEWPPVYTGYPWEALQGVAVQAEILFRAGYNTYEWQDQAILRAAQFLYGIGFTPTEGDEFVPWLLDEHYGTQFAGNPRSVAGKVMGWTAWTHSRGPSTVETFQDGVLPAITYTGTQDTRISSVDPEVNFGTSGTLSADGLPKQASLLKWDINSIPFGSVVQSVAITLTVVNESVDSYEIYALNRDWDERAATWNKASAGVQWEVSGADGATDRGTTALGSITPRSADPLTIPLNATGVALVQSWIDDPSSNHGFIILDYTAATDGFSFKASDTTTARNRPKLVIGLVQNQGPAVLAGFDQTINEHTLAALDGTVIDDGKPIPPGAVTTTWSMVSGPGTVTFGNASAVDTTAGFSAPGQYVLRLSADDGAVRATEDVVITVNGTPIVDAGPDQILLDSATTNLHGTATDDGVPAPGSITTTWSVLSGPGTVTFGAASALDTTARFSAPGRYVLQLAASDHALTGADTVIVTVNAPPTADAGADQLLLAAMTASLHGRATDDGVSNPPGVLSTRWSLVGGPGTVTFGDATALNTAATFSLPGVYVLRLTVHDGAFTATDDLRITINAAPTANAGLDQTLISTRVASLHGSSTDDGLPNPPAGVTTTWTLVTGPGTVAFSNASSLDTRATFSASGVYVLRFTANDSALAGSDDVTVTINAAPAMNAGPDQTVLDSKTASLHGIASDDGLPTPARVTSRWSLISGPGTVTFGNAAALDTTAQFSTPGTYTLRLTGDDGALAGQDELIVKINAAPVVNAGVDQTIRVTGAARLLGTASDDGVGNPPGSVATTWTVVSGPASVRIGDATLLDTTARFDAAGTYVLRLTASDGALATADDLTVTVLPPPPPVTASFQDGASPTARYAGTQDTTISFASPAKAAGSTTSLTVDGKSDAAALLRWDTSSIPAGSVVQSVSITVNVATAALASSYDIYGVSQNWAEVAATWKNYSKTGLWQVAGATGAGDHGPAVLGTFSAAKRGLSTIPLNAAGLALVQSWVDGPAGNFGFIIQNYTATAKAVFGSSETSTRTNRPKLSVTYMPGDGAAHALLVDPASQPSPAGRGISDVLDAAKLDSIAAAARTRWAATGLDAAGQSRLTNVRLEIADLPNSYLAAASSDVIFVDRDASGHGWFIDATPGDDAEFDASSLRAGPDSAAADRMDLLSAIAHEMGHALGLDHASAHDQAISVMLPTLEAGVRHMPSAADVDSLLTGGDVLDLL